jgi:gamma-glutamyl-gamma-aminobutyrate hydrolase PuuD
MKPRIAVPHWRAPTWERTKYYLDSIEAVGGENVIVDEESLPQDVQGLMLLGGVDVDPALYGEKRGPKTERPHKERDEQELVLLRQALERDIPVLCICRGHQLLNVALGGSLVQDIEDGAHRWAEDGTSGWHEITLDSGGHLADVYGRGAVLRVNSRHHQGVSGEGLGKGLRVTAKSHDGWVEAVEGVGQRWLVGVQWHPERPEMHPDSDPLFGAFVDACRG